MQSLSTDKKAERNGRYGSAMSPLWLWIFMVLHGLNQNKSVLIGEIRG